MTAVTGKAQGNGAGSGAEFVSSHHEISPAGCGHDSPHVGLFSHISWLVLPGLQIMFIW